MTWELSIISYIYIYDGNAAQMTMYAEHSILMQLKCKVILDRLFMYGFLSLLLLETSSLSCSYCYATSFYWNCDLNSVFFLVASEKSPTCTVILHRHPFYFLMVIFQVMLLSPGVVGTVIYQLLV